MTGPQRIDQRCVEIADQAVPEYRSGLRSYSCGGHTAKRWQAAYDGARLALVASWHPPSAALDGEDVLLWRQDGHRADNLYGVREVGMFDAESEEWFDGNGDSVGSVRAWTHLPPKPTTEQLAALTRAKAGGNA